MKIPSSTSSVLLCSALFVATVAATSATPAPRRLPQAPPPAGDEALSAEDMAARTTFESVCSVCHDPAVATTTLRTRQEWGELFDLMVSYGASASDAQFAQIQRYLGRRYGKVNVNRAPADELQLVLDVSPEVAQAIIDYRSTMRLTSAEDLKRVPGLAASKVDGLKTRLQF
jgi:competence ComEA-like helix-hairpin-helix protein